MLLLSVSERKRKQLSVHISSSGPMTVRNFCSPALYHSLTHSLNPLRVLGCDQRPPVPPVFRFLPWLSPARLHLLFYCPSPGLSRSSYCSFPGWSPVDGDSGDDRWLHPEGVADPAPPFLCYLRAVVVSGGCPV